MMNKPDMARRTPVLFILPGLGFGGAEILTLKIINYLVLTQSYKVSLIVIGKRTDLLSNVNKSCEVVCLNISSKPNQNFFASLGYALRLFKSSSLVVPTLYISQLLSVAFSVVTLTQKPILACIHNCSYALREIGVFSYLSISSFFFLRLNPNVAYVFCSHSAYLKHKMLACNKKSFVINNGYSIPTGDTYLSSSSSPHCLKHGRITTSSFKILFIARYHPHKDYSTFLLTLLALVNIRSDFSVTVVGATYDQLCECASNLGLSSHLKQQLSDLVGTNIIIYAPHPNVSFFYENHDILLLTSLSEAFPNVVVEAQAFGLYVVSTDVGDVSRMVYDPSLLAPRSRHMMLAQRLLYAFALCKTASYKQDKQKIISFAMNKFSITTMLESYEQLIKTFSSL